jgi:hypothetical protein
MNMKRMRGRNHRPNGGGGGNNGGGGGFRNQQNGIPLNRNHVFDSSGPEMRVRGTAQQLYEKYQQLARDASSNGDRVTGEAYYQHAEHYFRIISAINQAQGHPPQGQAHSQPNGQANGQNGQNYEYPSQVGYNQGQERNANQARPVGETQNGQQNGHYNNQNRRYEPNNGERPQDLQLSESAQQDTRPEPQRNDNRPIETRTQENRQQDNRPAEGRPAEGRPFEPRRNDQPRNRQEYQRNDRNNDRQERFRPEAPVVDTRIDISSALEAELAAAVAEPEVHQPVLEARAIPIIPDAPPPVAVARPAPRPAARQQADLLATTPVADLAAAETAEAPARPAPKPRGRPRTVKAAPTE